MTERDKIINTLYKNLRLLRQERPLPTLFLPLFETSCYESTKKFLSALTEVARKLCIVRSRDFVWIETFLGIFPDVLSGNMALHSELSLSDSCSSNVTSQYKDYFEYEYDGTCMDGHYYLGNCTFPWVSHVVYLEACLQYLDLSAACLNRLVLESR